MNPNRNTPLEWFVSAALAADAPKIGPVPKLRLFQCLAAGLLSLLMLAPAQSSVVYDYEQGTNHFAYTAPGLTTGTIAAADLDSCSFAGFACASLVLGPTSLSVVFVPGPFSALSDFFGLRNCPTFAVGGVYSTFTCLPTGTFNAQVFTDGFLFIREVSTVPEPGSLALLGLGLAGLAALRRRRQSL